MAAQEQRLGRAMDADPARRAPLLGRDRADLRRQPRGIHRQRQAHATAEQSRFVEHRIRQQVVHNACLSAASAVDEAVSARRQTRSNA